MEPITHRFFAAFLLASLALVSFAHAQGGDAEQSLRAAVAQVQRFDFNAAYDLFSAAARKADAGSEGWQEAVYGQAVCAQQMRPLSKQRNAEAADLYRLLIETSPKSKYSPRAMMNLGRIAELSDYIDDVVDLPAARKRYQQIIDGWPTDPIAGEATLRIAASYIGTYEPPDVQRGIKILETWLDAHPDDRLASAMWQYLGDTYFFPLQDNAKALDCYRAADRLGLLEKGREWALYWRMAVLAERLAQRDVAAPYYTKIIEKTPTSGKAYQAQLALKRLGAPVPSIRIYRDLQPAGGH